MIRFFSALMSCQYLFQDGSGTGVHIGHGMLLTCAHVIDSRDDSEEGAVNHRVGRDKLVSFLLVGRLLLPVSLQ